MHNAIKYSVLAVIPLLYSFNALTGASAVKTLNGDDVDGSELRSVQVEGFEADTWSAVVSPGDPEAIPAVVDDKGSPMQGEKWNSPEVAIKGEANKPCRPQNLAYDETNKKCLGVRFKFIYPGNNVVALIPPNSKKVYRVLDELDHNNKPKVQEINGLKLPGKVKAVSVWVLGRGNDYTLEAWVQDWKGSTHVLKMGSVNFVGWRPLTAKVPANIPQDIDTYPQTKNLILTKLVLRSKPAANTEKVVVFFDAVKVLSDMYDVHFDGADVDFDDMDKKEKNETREYAKQLKKYSEGQK
ncbi:MAG TPA: flagellar filament outer layer protein FlaA [Turneriella sp.]|nr:flagellar filament outer layer protein FlaA [Turneriella sp.]HNJ65299.1 flagellar filament outer layer protein FlaA [Turneriella sp.]HNL11248.1 flagellar filament outer layer protein FlaA [Turneriella sp.]